MFPILVTFDREGKMLGINSLIDYAVSWRDWLLICTEADLLQCCFIRH